MTSRGRRQPSPARQPTPPSRGTILGACRRMPPVTNKVHVPDVICLSHLRWNFVFQRPQHLMTRCARDRRVFFVEEPEFGCERTPSLRCEAAGPVTIVVPQLAADLGPDASRATLRQLLDAMRHTY